MPAVCRSANANDSQQKVGSPAVDLLDLPYMQRALLAGVLLAVPLGLLGVWVVLRGLAFFSHAVGVATFPGLVAGLAPGRAAAAWFGALAAGGGFAASVGAIERDPRLRGGAVSGLVLAGALALGAVLLPVAGDAGAGVQGVLFGSLLGIGWGEVAACAALALVVSPLVLWWTPRLAAASFDPAWAESAGAASRGPAALVAVLVTVAVVVALPAVGSLLVAGLVVVPAATARLLVRHVGPLLVVSVALSVVEVVLGLVLAHALDAPPGAAIATLGGLGFFVAAVAGRAQA